MNFDTFIQKTSFTGLCTLYAIGLSFEKHQAFKPDDVFEEILGTSQYSYGFIVACSSVDMLEYNLKNDVLTIKSISFDITKLKNKIYSLLESDFQHSKEEVKKIEDFFD